MKVIKEYSNKVLIFIFISVFILETFVFIFIYQNSNNIYNKLFEDTLNKSAKKSKESLESINHFVRNIFMSYMTKLKLINKHAFLYSGKEALGEKNIINKNSKIFNKINLNNKIIEAKTDVIYQKKIFKDLYNETTGKFNYIDNYMKKYGKDVDKNILMNKLLKEHDELNYVSYHNCIGDEFDINNLEKEDIKRINYLIPIFKSIFIERLITKRDKMDIRRIFVLNKRELIIYPPEDSTKIYLYKNTNDIYLSSCSKKSLGNYYSCIYDYIYYLFYEGNYMAFLKEYEDTNNLIYSLCVKLTYFEGNFHFSLLCLEVNFSYLINSINFFKTKNINLGLATDIFLYKEPYYDFSIIYNTNRNLNEIYEVFNNSKYTPEDFVVKEDGFYYSLYHVLYLETTKVIKEHPELKVSISDLEKEYEYFRFRFLGAFDWDDENNAYVNEKSFNRTICRKKIISNEYECFKDEFRISTNIYFIMKINEINEDIVNNDKIKNERYNIYIYSISYTNPKMNEKDIGTLTNIKLIRIILFYFFLTLIFFMFFILFINIFSEYTFDNINDLLNKMNEITFNAKTKKINILKNNKNFHPNNEMLDLDNIYELLNRALIIKEIFENDSFLQKHKLDLNILLNNINNKKIKEICNSFYAIFHFNNNIFNLAENEFRSIIYYIKDNQNRLIMNGIDESDKIKEAIKRSSIVPYLNEYSEFENIDENMIDTIYLNIYKQRFIYLYAMTKYKYANEINNEINNNKNKKNKEKYDRYLNEAIKYFKECKNINKSLGINQIKIIYSLIMISKCYLNLNDYKNSIININEALSLYFTFSKFFNKYNSKYNPKVMLFVEINIYQHILLTISNICMKFNKPYASYYIIFQIFNISPFIISNVQYQAGINLMNYLDKNKNRIKKLDSNFSENIGLMIEYKKIQKYLPKIISRLYIKNFNNENKKGIKEGYTIDKKTKNQTNNKNIISYKYSSNLNASKYKSINTVKNKYLKKNITICLCENVLEKIKWEEFKDVLIKYLKKYFSKNEDDEFGFVQFGINGLKTKIFLSQTLDQFISKLIKVKNNIILTNNKSQDFIGLFEIFESIINNYKKTEERDNIIMILINANDIRFSSISDCINNVEALNENNTSIFFLCYDKIIEEDKINNIQSFLNGLIEGYFFHIHNYQQLKEIFVNLSITKHQTNFFKFDFGCFDHNL